MNLLRGGCKLHYLSHLVTASDGIFARYVLDALTCEVCSSAQAAVC